MTNLSVHDVHRIELDEGHDLGQGLAYVKHIYLYSADGSELASITLFSSFDKKEIRVIHRCGIDGYLLRPNYAMPVDERGEDDVL